ncbi:MAG: efflux transporter periplasmic adaptor subunit [Burkholderiales bacterium PBB4]|nr:MAG: efflux transporter periplasmic adaptor subunit [Burkholderiales bacterium PBB4]
MQKRTWWWMAAAAVLVVALGWWASRGRGASVQVVQVARTGIVQSIAATGRMNAVARMDMGADVTATVQEVRVREGDVVRAGQVLVRLQDSEALAAVQQARAALAEAQGRAVQQTTVTAPVAQQVVLVAQGFYSQQKQDDARRVLDTARSALEAARVQATANQAQGVEPALAASRIHQAQAALDAAQARLARLQISSPVNAKVLTRLVEPGSMAQPGKVLLTLAAEGTPRIDASVDEKHLRMLTLGMPAKAVADAFIGQPFDAKLTYIAPAVDAQRGTVDVRLEVANPPSFLKPDMTVSVELVGGARKDALVLPSVAVRDADREAPWVLALQEGKAVRVAVKLGLRGVGSVEVLQGLAEGDTVIPQTEKVVAGDTVRAGKPLPAQAGMEVPSFIR